MKGLIKFLTNYDKLIYIIIMIIPWLTVLILGKKDFKRFTPGALYICIFVLFEGMLAHKRL